MPNHPVDDRSDLDVLSTAERMKFHQRSLLRLWDLAIRHPLTRRRFPQYQAAEPTPENIFAKWSEIPPDSATDHLPCIRKEGEYRAFHTNGIEARIVCSSGGSTGKPKLLVSAYEEALCNASYQGKGYRRAGITAHDTVATFGGSGTFAIDYGVYHALAQVGCTIVPFVDFHRAEENCEVLEMLRINVLLALPSKLYPLISYLEERGRKLENVRLVVTGGEPLSCQLKSRLMARCGTALAFGSTFCTSDHGAIGYQCSRCGDGEYHLHEGMQYVELVASEEGGSPNELVVSNLRWSYMPVVRLRTGDCAEWTDYRGDCLCGKTSRKIRLLGRMADTISIGGAKINGRWFSELPGRVGIHENLMHVLVRTGCDGRDVVEIALNGSLRDRYEKALRSALMENATFARIVREQRVIGPHFVTETDGMENTSGYGKLKVLRDMR